MGYGSAFQEVQSRYRSGGRALTPKEVCEGIYWDTRLFNSLDGKLAQIPQDYDLSDMRPMTYPW